MKKNYLTKSLLAAVCATSFCLLWPVGLFAQDNGDEWGTPLTLDFGGLLDEPESYYVSDDSTYADGYYYRTEFEEAGFVFSHYWGTFSPYFGGGFTYSNGTDVETPGYMNMSAYAGTGYGDDTYLVANASSFTSANLTYLHGQLFAPREAYFTNTTYDALSMLQGDAVAKKFGGEDGTDPDWLRVVIRGYEQGEVKADTVVFYLADYRSDNSADDYIVRDWTRVDLSPLGVVDSLTFEVQSSDVGEWGINTPTYFCMDQLTADVPFVTGVEEVAAAAPIEECVAYADGVLALKHLDGTQAAIYTLSGQLLSVFAVEGDDYACTPSLLPGRYVVRTEKGGCVIQVH